jgi:hypothetical protein
VNSKTPTLTYNWVNSKIPTLTYNWVNEGWYFTAHPVLCEN